MKNKRILLIISILLLVIGFAAVTTTLFINGSTTIETNKDDFDVFFSRTVINNIQDNSIIIDKTHIEFETTLGNEKTFELVYDVKNGSSQYDANVKMTCTNGNEYILVNNSFDDTKILEAKKTRTGIIKIELIKQTIEERKFLIECDITAEAISRTEIGKLINVDAQNSEGVNLNATADEITGTNKEELLNSLIETGYINNIDEVNALIEVKSDNFNDLAITTFDVSNIAQSGDNIAIIHYNEKSSEWEFISIEEVNENGMIIANFSSYSPVAFIVITNDEQVLLKQFNKAILGDNDVKTNYNYTATSINNEETGLFVTNKTNTGNNSYFFRGNVNNNNLKFANLNWKIVRINEDNTIRIILNQSINNGQKYVYNSNASAGYISSYYSNSNIVALLNNWYKDNIISYDKYIVNGEYYCEEARLKWGIGGAGNAILYSLENYEPNFKCKNDNNGYGIITSNIGLITFSELWLAGGYPSTINDNFYLNNSESFWTMTTGGQSSSGYASVLILDNTGKITGDLSNGTETIRPVINLKGNIPVTGDGTEDNPYTIYK